MGKRIIVTSGPTNERIDSVMKITNMSTGALGATIVDTLIKYNDRSIERIYYLSTKLSRKPKVDSSKVTLTTIESTEDLIRELELIFKYEKIDAVIHSAAVGDYKAKYSVRAEDLISEILEIPHDQMTTERLLEVFENPKCAADDSGKMSSYEPHLMTMMTLTPKVIGMIKEKAPEAMLIGFKLLDGVSKEELLEVASKLREKNNADYIIANDLSRIGGGQHWAMVVSKNGKVCELTNKDAIAHFISLVVTDKISF